MIGETDAMREHLYDYLIGLGIESGMAQYWVVPALAGLCILAISATGHFAERGPTAMSRSS